MAVGDHAERAEVDSGGREQRYPQKESGPDLSTGAVCLLRLLSLLAGRILDLRTRSIEGVFFV